jgi:hypothetical protein
MGSSVPLVIKSSINTQYTPHLFINQGSFHALSECALIQPSSLAELLLHITVVFRCPVANTTFITVSKVLISTSRF